MKPAFRVHPSRLACTTLLVALAACGGRADEMHATPEDVDEAASAVITEREYAAFSAPADSMLSVEQVEAYLKTSLLQFDLVRDHAERLHGRFQEMERRAERGGAVAGLRNLMDAGRTLSQVGDLIGGSYVRSARTLGYNPAEMEWVRERMAEVATHLVIQPMHAAAAQSAVEMRTQIDALREQLAADPQAAGFAAAQIDGMQAAADRMETDFDPPPGSRAAEANHAVLQRARPAVTDAMWSAIGMTGGASGLIAWGGLSDPADAEAQRRLDEWRQLFSDALADRVTPGMEHAAP